MSRTTICLPLYVVSAYLVSVSAQSHELVLSLGRTDKIGLACVSY